MIFKSLGVRALIARALIVRVLLSMDPAGLFGNSLGVLTVPWLTARETAALIVVVVSLLFFRVFRERCLLVWGAGWIAYGAFLWVAGAANLHGVVEVDGGIRAGRLCAGDGDYLRRRR